MSLRQVAVAVGLTAWLAPGALGAPVASVHVEGARLVVRPLVEASSVSVTVTGPAGFVRRHVFGTGEAAALDLAESATRPVDGVYVYEVRLGPPESRGEDEPDRTDGEPRVLSGVFRVTAGQAALPLAQAEPRDARTSAPVPDAQVLVGDVSVQGSLCAGDVCTASEPFGAANLLLKQQNNRIHVDDTSTAAGVPANDWQLTFNDSTTNGASKFALEDLTNATTPFTVMAGARSNALVVDPFGRLGLGTATPSEELTIVGALDAAIALRPTLPSARTWTLQGTGSSFSLLDFDDSEGFTTRLLIDGATGNIGLGLLAVQPAASLHVQRGDGTSKLLVEERSPTVVGRNLLQLKNNGPVTLRFDNASNGTAWGFGSIVSGNRFFMSASGASALSMTLDPAGNMTIAGALTQSSDRDAKDDIVAVDPAQVLAQVAELPIATWRYKGDAAVHAGPMAQDFHAAFGLGPDDKHIAPADLAGLSLAAVQALHADVAAKDERLRELSATAAAQAERLRELTDRLARLEAALAEPR